MRNPYPSQLKAFVFLLHRVVSVRGSDCSFEQMGFNLAPIMCKPRESAYMSIRHQVDLRRIRPVLTFLIENASSIFTRELKPRPVPAAVVAPSKNAGIPAKSSEGSKRGASSRAEVISMADKERESYQHNSAAAPVAMSVDSDGKRPSVNSTGFGNIATSIESSKRPNLKMDAFLEAEDEGDAMAVSDLDSNIHG